MRAVASYARSDRTAQREGTAPQRTAQGERYRKGGLPRLRIRVVLEQPGGSISHEVQIADWVMKQHERRRRAEGSADTFSVGPLPGSCSFKGQPEARQSAPLDLQARVPKVPGSSEETSGVQLELTRLGVVDVSDALTKKRLGHPSQGKGRCGQEQAQEQYH